MASLYEYAVIYTPLQTKDQADRGEVPEPRLIVPITPVLASSNDEVQKIAARAIPDEYEGKIKQCKVVFRPF